MKRHLYLIAALVSFFAMTSCNKSTPAPASPVIGRWELTRGLLSGFSNATLNGASIDLYYFNNYGSRIDIFADNTFNDSNRQVTVDDATGTWKYDNNTLTLTYDAGGSDTYTYTNIKNIEELTNTVPQNYSLPVSTTAVAAGKVAFVYRK